MTSTLIEHYEQVQQRIREACLTAQRDPKSVHLLAVSKFHSMSSIRTLASHGQRSFGENYVQELVAKAQALSDLSLTWHFIGPLQSNKAKLIAQHAHWMHSLDRPSIAEQLQRHRPSNMSRLNVCLQVNIDAEPSKSGITDFDALSALAKQVLSMNRLSLQGLMTIPAPCAPEQQHLAFAKLRDWRDRLVQTLGIELPHLSMGMSADLTAAIAEGATIVRVGTDIFGARPTLAHAISET